jgi:hypothetical protein
VGKQIGQIDKNFNNLPDKTMKQHIRRVALRNRRDMLTELINSENGVKITNALKAKIEQYHASSRTIHKHKNLKEYIANKLMYTIFFRNPDSSLELDLVHKTEFLECRIIRRKMKEIIDEAGESEILEEDSLSVNTSDADRIESEYYIDDAIQQKANECNHKFEKRMKHVTQVIADRIQNSPKQPKERTFGKRKYDDVFDDDDDDDNYKSKRIKQEEDEDEYLDQVIASGKYSAKLFKSNNGKKYYSLLKDENDEIMQDFDLLRKRRHNQLKRGTKIERKGGEPCSLFGSRPVFSISSDINSPRHFSKRLPGQIIEDDSDSDSSDSE